MSSQACGRKTEAFSFDKWITDGLSDIKQVFIDKEMFDLTTLTMNNPNLALLMTDVRVLQKPHLTASIITSIQAFTTITNQTIITTDSIFIVGCFITKRERNNERDSEIYI